MVSCAIESFEVTLNGQIRNSQHFVTSYLYDMILAQMEPLIAF